MQGAATRAQYVFAGKGLAVAAQGVTTDQAHHAGCAGRAGRAVVGFAVAHSADAQVGFVDGARGRAGRHVVVASAVAVVDGVGVHLQGAAARAHCVPAGKALAAASQGVATDQAYGAGGARRGRRAVVGFAVRGCRHGQVGLADGARCRVAGDGVVVAAVAVVHRVARHLQGAATRAQYVFAGIRLAGAADRVTTHQSAVAHHARRAGVAVIGFAVTGGVQGQRGLAD